MVKAIKVILLIGCIHQSAQAAEFVIPDVIKVPNGATELLTLHANGEQVYQCVMKEDAFKWIVYPDAVLTDAQGQTVGAHSKGPSWTYKDGSQVVGFISQKTNEPRDKAMPWLLVEAVSHKGNGVMSNVAYINRVNTQGGLEPKSLCNNNHLGSEKRVSYTADYIFYTR